MAWKSPKWTSSWINFDSTVTDGLSFPEKIEVADFTLQGGGELSPGVVITRTEALAIARKLDEVGVHRIVAGVMEPPFPEDVEIVSELAHLGLNAKIETVTGFGRDELDRAIKADVWGVDMSVQMSDFWLEEDLQPSRRRDVSNRAIDAIAYAKEHGLKVTINIRDAARADPNFVEQFVRTLSTKTKLDTIKVTDPYGLTSPQAFGQFIRIVKSWTSLPIAMHCHNDFGLATANALMGLSAGASIVNTTVNGIGERCGLTSLEEVAVALRILYNIDVGIRYEKLCELSSLVERATGPLRSKLKPIVGERAFAWETDSYVPGIKGRLPYEPDFVGNDFKFILGTKTGTKGIAWQAEKLGFKLTDAQLQKLRSMIRELSKKKQQPNDQEFLKMLQRISSPSE